jgi:hypothetical protein
MENVHVKRGMRGTKEQFLLRQDYNTGELPAISYSFTFICYVGS